MIGRRYEGFPDERWLDVRRFHLFAKPLERRFDICARKGFDAVELDHIAGWENKLEPSAYYEAAASLDFSAIGKSYDLFALPWRPCPPGPARSRAA